MTARPASHRLLHPQRSRQRGFTMFETIIVFAMLTAAAMALFAIVPRVFQTQTAARDEFVGVELLRACAERVLDVRRTAGFTAVKVNVCASVSPSGWNAPVVALSPSAGNPAACTGSPCTATISVAKSSGTAAPIAPITVQLSTY